MWHFGLFCKCYYLSLKHGISNSIVFKCDETKMDKRGKFDQKHVIVIFWKVRNIFVCLLLLVALVLHRKEIYQPWGRITFSISKFLLAYL